jgi:hypothetical protein
MQLPSAELLLKEFPNEVKVFHIERAERVKLLCLLSYLVFTRFAYASYLPYLYNRTVSTVYRTHFGLCRYLDT